MQKTLHSHMLTRVQYFSICTVNIALCGGKNIFNGFGAYINGM